MSFDKILVANRGEIARRIIRSGKALGYQCIAVYSEADRYSLHVSEADEAIFIGPSPAGESYLCIEKIIDAALLSGANALHPGYGFLSENAELADACAAAGLVFIGPSPTCIRKMGDKSIARRLAKEAGVPIIEGYDGANQNESYLSSQAARIGYPVLLKPSAGGGGKGMRVVYAKADFGRQLELAKREAKASFGNDHIIVERFVKNPRHIEFQVIGDKHGNLVHCFERECSIQRRHQKVIEETPSTALDKKLRHAIATL